MVFQFFLENIFFENRQKIIKKIFQRKFNKVNQKIHNNSLMVGIRMYEDVPNQDLKKKFVDWKILIIITRQLKI